jgi:hypothetical protein
MQTYLGTHLRLLHLFFQNLSSMEWPYNNHSCPKQPLPSKMKTKEAVRSARRVLHNCQLPDKSSRHNSRDIWNSWRYFKIFMYLFRDFWRNPVGEHWVRRWLLAAERRLQSQVTFCDIVHGTNHHLTTVAYSFVTAP